MKKKVEKEAKQRIFDAAVCLFARKGFDAVGIREIAKAAKVNISMINYYYGGMVGILRAIVNESNNKYYNAITNVCIEGVPRVDCVQAIVRNLIKFYRENSEVAMVASNILPVDFPEILDLKVKWIVENRARLNKLYALLDLDIKDNVQMSFIRGLLTAVLSYHFASRFTYEHIARAHIPQGKSLPEISLKYDDAYYDRLAELLTNFYLNGLKALTPRKSKNRAL